MTAGKSGSTSFLSDGLLLPGAAPDFVPSREGPVFGVNLGTTNSCVAVVENGVPKVLQTEQGKSTIPSLVTVTETGAVLVGHAAVNRLNTHPRQTVNESKRLIGAPFDGKLAAQMKQRVLYEICRGPQGQSAVLLQGRGVLLEEVAALILMQAKAMATAHFGRTANRAVVTCPAAYNELQRAAVRRAGHLAGLYVERVINEPTAAAVAYGYRKEPEDKKLAVFDLGGGTFDATVLHMKGSVFEVLSSGGDTFLGGADFDDIIVDYLLDEFYDVHHGVELVDEVEPRARLRQAAINAKHLLSSKRDAKISLPMLMLTPNGPLDLMLTLQDETLARIVDPLIERTIGGLNSVIRAPKLKPMEIDDVLLVGGMTRMPAVQKRLEKYFGKPPSKNLNPDEAVARGAAIVAHAIMVPGSQLKLKDVLSKTVGIADPRYGDFIKIIPRNTPVPASDTYLVSTTHNKQTTIKLHVFQGEDVSLDENEFLGTLTFDKLPKLPRGEVKIELLFKVNDENILEIEAHDLTTGRGMAAALSLEGGVPEGGRPTTNTIIKEGRGRKSLLDRLLRR